MSENSQEQSVALAVVPSQPQHMALEPVNFDEAWRFCGIAVDSGLLPKAVVKKEQAFLIYLRGREMGLTFMQSFASIHVIDGKTSMSAELILARVKQAKHVCKYFRYVSGDATQATFETWRVGDPEPTPYTFTWEDAVGLRLSEKDNYKKQPKTMLRWRCITTLARLVYPELTLGLYSPDEMEDIIDGTLAEPHVPAKPVLDGEFVAGPAAAPAPSASAAAAPSPAPASAPAPAKPAAGPAETLGQKEERLNKALADVMTPAQLDALRPELLRLPMGPERDRLNKAYLEANARVAAAKKRAAENGGTPAAASAPAPGPAAEQLNLGGSAPAERQPGEDD